MQFKEIEEEAIEILREAEGLYLLPYQIFNRIKERNFSLGKKVEDEYPVQAGNPTRGEGAGIYYSPASFVAHALNHFKGGYPEIDKQWIDAVDIEIEGIIPGSKEGTSIWAWK